MRFLLCIGLIAVSLLTSCSYYFGNSWVRKAPENPKMIEFSKERTGQAAPTQFPTNAAHTLLEYWADQPLERWGLKGKVYAPTVMIGKLARDRDVQAVNEFILKLEPWGIPGSTSAVNKKGDYDFTLLRLSALLWMFGDQPKRLWPESAKHIAENLLTEEGGKIHSRTPHTLGLMRDTENHILMTNISRYLKNQWMFRQGSKEEKYDNSRNGLDEWMGDYLDEMDQTGFFEFNANPYAGYTFTALMTLEAFADAPELREKSRRVLDHANYEFSFSEYKERRHAPFRRRKERAKDTNLQKEPHLALVQTWRLKAERSPVTLESVPFNRHQALFALLLSYQPHRDTRIYEEDIPKEFFARVGHGYHASPGIYSGGPGWLLCAGGVERGKVSQIAAREIALLLDDGATDLKDCLYLSEPGKSSKWNHTGVYRRFAVVRGAAHVPESWQAVSDSANWKIYAPLPDRKLRIALYEDEDLALMALFPDPEGSDPSLVRRLLHHNPHPKQLHSRFHFPEGTQLSYQLNAPKSKWVIESVDGEPTNQKHDRWPRHSIDY